MSVVIQAHGPTQLRDYLFPDANATMLSASAVAAGELFYGSTPTGVLGRLSAVAVGSVLVSGGVNTAPAWSATPTLTSLTLSSSGGSSVAFTNPSNNNFTCSGDFQCSNFYAVATGVMGWVNRILLEAPAIGHFTVENYAGNAGVGIDVTLDGTVKFRTRAYTGDAQVSAASVRGNVVAFASLPATPVEGMLVAVSDSNTAVWGATIAGGGANHVLASYNGTNWTVAGK